MKDHDKPIQLKQDTKKSFLAEASKLIDHPEKHFMFIPIAGGNACTISARTPEGRMILGQMLKKDT
jgi:hypothetical protein